MEQNMDILRLMKAIPRRIIAALNAFNRTFWGTEYSRNSYSQYGEDMVLRTFFARYPSDYNGCYVDVGAHHPKKYSNSNYFYEMGWQGICIDPIPGGKQLFSNQRNKDLFLEIGVSATESEMTYYIYDEQAHNTFSEESVKNLPIQHTMTKKIKTLPLSKIFNDYLPAKTAIDFLTIDAEGFDLLILQSNDWSLYRPKIVVIEEMESVSLDQIGSLNETRFMISKDYLALSRTPSAVYFVDTLSPFFDGGLFLNCI